MRLEFQQVQRQFAAHIRDPDKNPVPADIEPRRMKIYTELFFNNVEGFLSSAFPVLRKLTPDAHWKAMARDFYSRHQCHTPLFHRIAEEFLKYLDEERGEGEGDRQDGGSAVEGRMPETADPPFLRELAHYEWVELALSVAEDNATPVHAEPNGDLMGGIPVVSPLAWTLAYEYPVHRIAPDFQPAMPPAQPTFLIVYRTLKDEVKFMEINAVTARLMELTAESPDSGRALLQRVAAELKHPQPDAVVAEGERILNDLRIRGIILGTKR